MTRAFFAGIIATAIVSALLYLNARMDLLPQANLLDQIAAFNERLGLPTSSRAVWGTHAVFGVLIFPTIFAFLCHILPGRSFGQGCAFGIILWLAMMASFMPLAGHEVFARDLGAIFIGTMLAMCLIYGALLSITYVALTPLPED
ncbi:hypothetical protein L1787_21895 [Acuticoccus sp. M5D2P5]|uniref:DUF6789 family protein n=1 Tax=Acuticoccus kalidii TaxID=2910977 RepID=UPI001F472D29|nr:DUF6789 family protein [Acuticoccus kalidii]MCF3936046.1 hypothetical protein [Acuticoccus kalidii]